MPTSKNHRRGSCEEKNRRGKLAEKAWSFHGRNPMTAAAPAPLLLRPKTVPELASWKTVSSGGISPETRPRLTKMLVNVTIQGILGPVQVLLPPESTVGDLISAAARQYAKEARRPMLKSTDPAAYDLHYSQFSLESLERNEKVVDLGSRNFFLCLRKAVVVGAGEAGRSSNNGIATASSSSCSKEAEKASKVGASWLKFMDFKL